MLNIFDKIKTWLSRQNMEVITSWCIAGILLLGLVTRLLYWYGHQTIGRDESYYIEAALSYAGDSSHIGIFERQPPIPIWLLGNLFRICKVVPQNALMISRILALALGMSALVPFYFMGKILFEKRKYALLLMIFAAVQPGLVEYSAIFLRESFSLPLSVLVLWLLLEQIHSSACWKSILLGILIGWGTLCRLEFAEWGVFAGAGLCIPLLEKRRKWYRLAGDGITLCVSMAVSWLCTLAVMDIDIGSEIDKIFNMLRFRLYL